MCYINTTPATYSFKSASVRLSVLAESPHVEVSDERLVLILFSFTLAITSSVMEGAFNFFSLFCLFLLLLPYPISSLPLCTDLGKSHFYKTHTDTHTDS